MGSLRGFIQPRVVGAPGCAAANVVVAVVVVVVFVVVVVVVVVVVNGLLLSLVSLVRVDIGKSRFSGLSTRS